jgi:hypothetical protein
MHELSHFMGLLASLIFSMGSMPIAPITNKPEAKT